MLFSSLSKTLLLLVALFFAEEVCSIFWELYSTAKETQKEITYYHKGTNETSKLCQCFSASYDIRTDEKTTLAELLHKTQQVMSCKIM